MLETMRGGAFGLAGFGAAGFRVGSRALFRA